MKKNIIITIQAILLIYFSLTITANHYLGNRVVKIYPECATFFNDGWYCKEVKDSMSYTSIRNLTIEHDAYDCQITDIEEPPYGLSQDYEGTCYIYIRNQLLP